MTKLVEISCIGNAYIQPIFDLYWRLSHTKFSGHSKIRVSSIENGYSASIIVLIVFCIESLVNNLKYHKKMNNSYPLDFLKLKYPSYSDLWNKINELITLRNIIAHNHIWKIKYKTNKNWTNEFNIKRELLDGYGRGAFYEVVNMRNKTTKLLKFRIIPTMIGKIEAKKAIILLNEFSNFLDDQRFNYISNGSFKYLRKIREFKEIINLIEKTN